MASIATTVSGMLGMKAATRSPAFTPAAASACCRRETWSRSSAFVRRARTRSSPRKMIASPGPSGVAQQVLGEVEPRLREEPRAGHLRLVGDDGVAPRVGDHAAEVPHRRPEVLHPVDGEAVQRGVVGERRPVPVVQELHERGHVRGGDAFRRGGPERLVGHGRGVFQSSVPAAIFTSVAVSRAAAMADLHAAHHGRRAPSRAARGG